MTTAVAIDRTTALALVAEASRAPSAHNTQPARWRFTPEGEVQLFEDTGRRLVAGDPSGRDQNLGLGAALEGLAIALSRRGVQLESPAVAGRADHAVPGRPDLRLVARMRLSPDAEPHALSRWVTRRGTYRGRFVASDPAGLAALRGVLSRAGDVRGVFDPASIAALARGADAATIRASERPDIIAELYRWLRLSPRERAWARDGLTADCLGLSNVERVAARWLLQPRRFAWLARTGLHRFMLAEQRRTRSAWALAALFHPRTEAPLESGRRLYRWWLELTAAGFAACPISALVDDPETEAEARTRFALPDDAALTMVFAVGRPSPAWRAVSPRLPAAELLV